MKKLINQLLNLLGLGKQAPAKFGKTLMMYGRVNKWMISEKTLKQDIKDITKAKIDGYIIELAGWGSDDQWCDEWMRKTEKNYKFLLDLCRKNGLWLFVSIVNDNMGKGKYGDKGPLLSKVYGKAQLLAQMVHKYKKDNVIVQPVAETQTSHGHLFDDYCSNLLKDFVLVYNGSSGRPQTVPAGFHYRAWHPANTTAKTDPANNFEKTFVVSDHGTIIQELGEGLEGPGKPAVVEKWAKRLKDKKFAVVGYYAFKYEHNDKNTINALGRAKS